MVQQPSAPPSLCQHVGHEWRTTTSDRYRTCCRKACGLVQRHDGTTWIDTSSPAVAKTKRHVATATSQPLFDPRTLFPFDKEAERRAEQSYYRLLGK